jgi:hypothetical protein
MRTLQLIYKAFAYLLISAGLVAVLYSSLTMQYPVDETHSRIFVFGFGILWFGLMMVTSSPLRYSVGDWKSWLPYDYSTNWFGRVRYAFSWFAWTVSWVACRIFTLILDGLVLLSCPLLIVISFFGYDASLVNTRGMLFYLCTVAIFYLLVSWGDKQGLRDSRKRKFAQ